jgi:hypothetical protein
VVGYKPTGNKDKQQKRSEIHKAVESQRVCDKPLLFCCGLRQGGNNNNAKQEKKQKHD